MQLLNQTCHSAKADLGKWPNLRFWTSTISLCTIESPVMVRSDFVWESQVHFMSISAHRKHKNMIHVDFIASNGGATTFILRVYVTSYPDINRRVKLVHVLKYLKYTCIGMFYHSLTRILRTLHTDCNCSNMNVFLPIESRCTTYLLQRIPTPT